MQNAELLGCAGFLDSENILGKRKIRNNPKTAGASYMPKGINTEAGACREKARASVKHLMSRETREERLLWVQSAECRVQSYSCASKERTTNGTNDTNQLLRSKVKRREWRDERLLWVQSAECRMQSYRQECGVNARDEVIVRSFTFCASSHPVTYQ